MNIVTLPLLYFYILLKEGLLEEVKIHIDSSLLIRVVYQSRHTNRFKYFYYEVTC